MTANLERIEFHVLQNGDAFEWFSVPYNKMDTRTIGEYRAQAIDFARKAAKTRRGKITVDMVKTYCRDETTIWPDPDTGSFDESDQMT